jgi:hypothetical protein
MATKVYDSPTMNLFALLADEHAAEPQAKKTKASTNKGPEQELTPKERAEAKAVQDAARKEQREKEKAKQEAEAARRKALDMIDDTGFSQQRHQRIKEIRQQERNPEPPKSPKNKEGWGDETKKGEGKGKGSGSWNKGESTPKGDWNKGFQTKSTDSKDTEGKAVTTEKNFNKDKTTVKGDGKGNFKGGEGGKGKGNFNKGEGGKGKEGNFTKGGPRSYDKHSQGVTSRQFQAKKQGHGKANWDDAVPAGLNAAPVKDALASESLAAAGTAEVDDNTPAPTTEGGAADAPATTGDAPAAGTPADKKKDDDSDSDEDKMTLDQYMTEQAKKKEALEAVVGKISQPRQLSDDEKKALTKFTLVENTKVVKKPENKPAPKPAAPTTTTTTAAPTGARKGEKAVKLDSVLDIRVAGARTGRRGPRPEGTGAPRDNAGRGGQRKGGRGPQKIPKGKNDFPDLGPK